MDNLYASLAAGIDLQDQSLSPDDPTATSKGFEAGFMISGDLAFSGDDGLAAQFAGSYSTAFERYWTRARLALDLGNVTVGPEALAFGSEEFGARRLGGFATVRLNLTPSTPIEFSASVGHQFVADQDGAGSPSGKGGGAGTYATISTGMSF